jgi:hypothetical protein
MFQSNLLSPSSTLKMGAAGFSKKKKWYLSTASHPRIL